MHDVIVIGGGVSGLSVAYNLMVRGVSVQLLERQVRVGGNAVSTRFNGFLMEHGPSTFNASVPDAVAQIDGLGLLDDAFDLGPQVKKRYLRHNGKLSGISTHPMGFFTSNYLSLFGRLRMAMEGLQRRKPDDAEETIHAFATRRFGREFAEKVIEPLAAGLFMGDAKKLSIDAAFARLPEMEQKFGSITRGVLRAKKDSAPGRHLYSWAQGVGQIPATLSSRLGERVLTGICVTKIRKTANGFVVYTADGARHAKAVVLAVQPHVAAQMLDGLEDDAAQAAGAIYAPPINVVFLGYQRSQVAHPLDGLGVLSTKDDSRIVSGVQFPSTMYPGRAPDGHVAISAYAGGVRNPELAQLSDAELIALVSEEIGELLGITGKPVVMRTQRWALGLPQYALGHNARRTTLETTQNRLEGLYVVGNFLQGVSLANCLDGAQKTAEKVALQLTGKNMTLKAMTAQA